MILIKKQKGKYIKYICQGQLESLQENKALASILDCIDKKDYTLIPGIEKHMEGMKSNFKAAGYIDNDSLTPVGKEIIETKMEWTPLRGTHSFGVIECEGGTYVINHACDYNGGYNYDSIPSPKFIGEFECNGMRIRKIQLERKALKKEEKPVDIECMYDFDTGKSCYEAFVNNNKFAFNESRESFSIMDAGEMDVTVEREMKKYGLTYYDRRVTIVRFDSTNAPLNNALEEIFETGYFSHSGSITVKNIRLSIEDSRIAKSVLLKYLEWNAEKRYCGKNEINRLISDFYTLFDGCATVESGTLEIFEELLEHTSKNNPTAYLHLMACKDLEPINQGKVRSAKPVSLGGKQKTMRDVVKAIVGERQNVASVSIADKFAAINAAISRALCLFADALKSEYNAELILYLAESNSPKASKEINKSFYDKLKTHNNIKTVTVSNDDLKEIHDRYYRIEAKDGDYWVTTTNELNALRYTDDYIGGIPREDISISTRGQMLDFTIIPLDREDVRTEVKELLGKK